MPTAPEPLPPVIETVGVEVYPEPWLVTLIWRTYPFEITAVAAPPEPPPPVIVTTGAVR